MAEFFITPLFRAVWHESVADDTELSDAAVRVAVKLGTYFSNHTAETYVAQPTLAKALNCSERKVWGALKELEQRGHLTVRQGGRATNYYRMPVEKIAISCEIYLKKSRSILRDSRKKIPQDSARFNPEISQNRERNPAGSCEQTPYSSSKKNSTAAPINFDDAWQRVRARLAERLGQEPVDTWLGSTIKGCEIADGIVTLTAPTRFLRDEIEKRFSDSLLDVLRAEDANVTAVHVALPQAGKDRKQVAATEPREADRARNSPSENREDAGDEPNDWDGLLTMPARGGAS